MAPLISVIITNYNRDNYIAEAIESILKQTFKAWELIIVDDGSTDGSVEVIEKYLGDKRIKLVVHDENKGCSQALLTGLEYLNSEIFMPLDSDDVLTADALKIMYKAHQDYPDCGLIYSQSVLCDENLNPKRNNFCASLPEGHTGLDVGNYVSMFKTYKKFYYDQTAGFDPSIKRAVDKDIIYKMEEVSNLKFIDEPLYLVRRHEGETLSQGGNRIPAKKFFEIIKQNATARRSEFMVASPNLIITNRKTVITDTLGGELPPISLILPYKPANPEREKILEWTIKRYEKVFPEFEICIGLNEDRLFNKAKAVNEAVRKASHDILCLADTDALFDRDVVIRSLALMNKVGCVRVTRRCGIYGTGCLALQETSTEKLFEASLPLKDTEVVYDSRLLSGHYCLVKRECFDRVNGFDEAFKGWGAEDSAFFHSLRVCCGRPGFINGPVYHLWHTPSPERDAVTGENRKKSKNYKRWLQYRKTKTPKGIEILNPGKETGEIMKTDQKNKKFRTKKRHLDKNI